MKEPSVFMIITIPEQPVRLVFHGSLSLAEQEMLMDRIATPEIGAKVGVVEKFKDSEFHYTIFTLTGDYGRDLDVRLREVFPAARRLTLDKTSGIPEAVRSIVI